MNRLKFDHRACTTLLVVLVLTSAVRAETAYVTDMLQLELYATDAVSGQPMRRLRSGDQMEVLERRSRIARVQLQDGQTGWVKSLYIVDKEPARTRVNKLEDENKDLQAVVDKLREQLNGQQSRVAELEGAESSEAERQAAVQAELRQLRTDNAEFESRLSSYDNSVPFSWFMGGVLLCLALGCGLGWYLIDSWSRARHGGYRVY